MGTPASRSGGFPGISGPDGVVQQGKGLSGVRLPLPARRPMIYKWDDLYYVFTRPCMSFIKPYEYRIRIVITPYLLKQGWWVAPAAQQSINLKFRTYQARDKTWGRIMKDPVAYMAEHLVL